MKVEELTTKTNAFEVSDPSTQVSAEEYNTIIKALQAHELQMTPSGDPLHYLYTSLGAVWGGSQWTLNDETLTTDEVRFIYLKTGIFPSEYALYARTYSVGSTNFANLKTTFPTIFSAGKAIAPSMMWMPNLKIVRFTADESCSLKVENSFELRYCASLQEVRDILDFSSRTYNFDFGGTTTNLKEIRLKGVKSNIRATYQSLLSKESVLYMIQNVGSASIVITLHATVYDALSVDSDIIAALNSKPNVTLASA